MGINLTMFILEVLGTISFAVSGAIAGIKKEMDMLGVYIMAILTATGGGFIRDLTLGRIPPTVFLNSLYLNITILSVSIFLLGIYIYKYNTSFQKRLPKIFLEKLVNITDSLGLGIFTVSGVSIAISEGYGDNMFLAIFVGTITGVGGGMMRDLFTMQVPSIFVRHIYAVACMIGALLFFILRTRIDKSFAMILCVAVVVLIRYFSKKYKLSLPKIKF